MICSLLVASLSISTISPALAASAEPEVILSDDAQMLIENSVFDSSEFEGVVEDQYGTYALTYEDVYLPVGRFDVSLTDEAAVNQLLAWDDLYQEVKDDIRNASQAAIEAGNLDATVTIFSPTFIESSTGLARDVHTVYGKYQNTPMQSIQLHYTGLSSGNHRVSSGAATVAYTKALVNLVISGLGIANDYISLFSMGKSAYEAVLDYYNAVNITASKNDFVEVAINYDCIRQWTYAMLGDQKYLGLVSQKSTLNHFRMDIYFYNAEQMTGKSYTKETSPNKTYRSAHFSDPWETAYRHYGGAIDESDIVLSVGSKRFHLNPPE